MFHCFAEFIGHFLVRLHFLFENLDFEVQLPLKKQNIR